MHKQQKIYFLIAIFLVIIFTGHCPAFGAAASTAVSRATVEKFPEVRIALTKDAVEVSAAVRGPYQLIDPITGKIVEEGKRLSWTSLTAGPAGIKWGKNFLSLNRVRLTSDTEIVIRLRGKERRYRESMEFIRMPGSRILVVNRLGMEDYIKGVLYHEISHRWPIEAIKAQAVAARTYALYRMGESAGQDFDMTNDIYSQVYGGFDSERYRTNQAVDATRGEVLLYKGKIFPAYFHATCGGFTEDASQLWKNVDLPPLKAVRCSFCLYSPHMWWKKNFRLKDIQDKLNTKGYNLGLIKEIRIKERDRSARIKDLEIVSRDDKITVISGKDFRNILGPNNVRSDNFRIEMKGYYLDLIGRGWGHGVGLCQWGALGMAQEGYNYKSILEYYYPSVEIGHQGAGGPGTLR